MMAPNPIKYLVVALEYAINMQDAIREGQYINTVNPSFIGDSTMIQECIDNLSMAHWAMHTFTPLAIGRTEENIPEHMSAMLFEDAPKEKTVIFLPREYSEQLSLWKPWVPRTVTDWRLVMQQGMDYYELKFRYSTEVLSEDFYFYATPDISSYKDFMSLFTVEKLYAIVR